jgi:hypothetical protein
MVTVIPMSFSSSMVFELIPSAPALTQYRQFFSSPDWMLALARSVEVALVKAANASAWAAAPRVPTPAKAPASTPTTTKQASARSLRRQANWAAHRVAGKLTLTQGGGRASSPRQSAKPP